MRCLPCALPNNTRSQLNHHRHHAGAGSRRCENNAIRSLGSALHGRLVLQLFEQDHRLGPLRKLRIARQQPLEFAAGLSLVAGLEPRLREMVADLVGVGRRRNRFLQQFEPARGVALLDQHPAQCIGDCGAETERAESSDPALLRVLVYAKLLLETLPPIPNQPEKPAQE